MKTVDIDEGAALLLAGELVAFPTETVYGLGARADHPRAVAAIFEAKGRPANHPLIVHLGSEMPLTGWVAAVPPLARRLADLFWPGPLTLILARGPQSNDTVTGGHATVAIRVPAHPVALELLRRVGTGLAAPSANRFGSVSPTSAEDVQFELHGRIAAVIDGGRCAVGVESTIVDLSAGEPRLVRPGGIPKEAIEDAIGAPLTSTSAIAAPGNLASHYAPRARLHAVAPEELRTIQFDEYDVVLTPAAHQSWLPSRVARILVPDEPVQRARELYRSLRDLDERGIRRAYVVMPDDTTGLGLAIADRLTRAAAPRE